VAGDQRHAAGRIDFEYGVAAGEIEAAAGEHDLARRTDAGSERGRGGRGRGAAGDGADRILLRGRTERSGEQNQGSQHASGKFHYDGLEAAAGRGAAKLTAKASAAASTACAQSERDTS